MVSLQNFGFKESPYERPQDKWVCGRLAEGWPCSLGPDANGCCRVTSVCQPHLEGERWHCRRSLQEGGPCKAGPLPSGQCCQQLEPCAPKRSTRVVRNRIVAWATALCVGFAAIFLGSQHATGFLMPGPLSSSHASLTNCQSCHGGIKPDRLGWLHSFVVAVEPAENAKLCLSCHDVGTSPFAPHTHPVDRLRQLTAQYSAGDTRRPIQNDSWVHQIAFPTSNANAGSGEQTILCATCHEEHQGTFHDQKTVSNNRCQSCHTSKFGAFAASHPEFTDYPFNRRTRIVFDHKGHFEKHFPKTEKTGAPGQTVPTVCADCHRPGAGQKYMEISSYFSMCASCHDQEILGTARARGPKGVDFLAVPGLDVATLKERGVDIGEWPADSEAELTVFMRALIASGPEGANIINNASGLDLLDLTSASDAELGQAKELAWSVKKLFSQLENSRLSDAMTQLPVNGDGTKVDQLQLAWLTGTISHDVIMSGNQAWFPNLRDDLTQFLLGQPTKGFAAAPDNQSETAGQMPVAEPEKPEPAKTGDDADILPDGDEDILGEGNEETGETDALSDNEDSGNATDDSSLELEVEDSAEDDALTADSEETPADNAGSEDQTDEPPTAPVDPESWAALGGWYRADFTIRYRPTSHSDRFLRTWLDYAGRAAGTAQKAVLTPVFEKLSASNAIGRCTKCHSVDDEDGFKHVKWQAFSSKRVKTRFTAFSHEPHIRSSGIKGCVLCHALDRSNADYLKTFEAGNAQSFASNFTQIDKAVCSTCHTEQTAGESCTLCHSYHATKFSRPLVKTKLK